MANSIGFTKAVLQKFIDQNQGRRAALRDSQQRGLVADLRESGLLTFYLYKRVQGRPSRLRIGPFPEVTVEAARTKVKAWVGDEANGKNPVEERRTERHEKTIKGLWEFWLARAKGRKRDGGKEDERQYKAFIEPWAGRRLSAISTVDVEGLHARIGDKNGRYAANRVLALLRAMFNKAAGMGYKGRNPCLGVEAFPEEPRRRFLKPQEMPAFFAALDAEPDAMLADLFRFALFTGARKSNVVAARWGEIDLDEKTWTIPKTKSGESVTIALSPPAVDVLKRRLKARLEAKDKSEWVFPSRGKTGHIVEPKTAWKRIIKAAGLSDLRPHDLRRTLGSWQAGAGVSMAIVGKSLGHKPGSPVTATTYGMMDLDPVRIAVESATAAMMKAAKPAKRKGGRGNG